MLQKVYVFSVIVAILPSYTTADKLTARVSSSETAAQHSPTLTDNKGVFNFQKNNADNKEIKVSKIRGDVWNGPSPTDPSNTPIPYESGIETSFQNRAGSPIQSLIYSRTLTPVQEVRRSRPQIDRSSIPINRFGVSEIKSPLFQLQQQQQQILTTNRQNPPRAPFFPTPAPVESEEYYWDSEGDADYLTENKEEEEEEQKIIPAPSIPRHKIRIPELPVDTYNIVITKNESRNTNNQKLHLLRDSQVIAHHLGPQLASREQLEQLVRSAVNAASQKDSSPLAVEEAIAQVVEEPGKAATINVLNSTIGDVGEVEGALNELLGSQVVYSHPPSGPNYPDSSISVGYVKETKYSVIDKILNDTVGYPVTNHSKTNVVNIFIINVVGQPTDVLSVNPWEKYNNRTRPSILHNLPYPNKHNLNNKASDSQGINLNENTVLNLLPDFVRATTIPPIVPLYNSSLLKELGTKPSVLGLLPNELFNIKRTNAFETYSNGGGIVRKEGTDIDMFNGENEGETSSYPSGQYQHTVFANGNVQQPYPVPSNPVAFRSNLKNLYDFNPVKFSIDDKSSQMVVSKVPVPQLVSNSKVQPVKGTARNPAPTELETKSTDSSKSSEKHEPEIFDLPSLRLIDIIRAGESGNFSSINRKEYVIPKQVAPIKDYHKNTKKPGEKKSPFNIFQNLMGGGDEEEVLSSLETDYNMNKMMKALAIGALPSSVAVASALWPVWAPMLFGKKRRKRSESKFNKPDWFSLLNGSKYYTKRKDKSRTNENQFGSSKLSALVKLGSIHSNGKNKYSGSLQNLNDKSVTEDFETTNEESKENLDKTLIRTTRQLFSKDGDGDSTGDSETTRQFTMSTSKEFYIADNFDYLTTSADSSTSENRNYIDLVNMNSDYSNEIMKSESSGDKVLVNNFLNAAVSGWMGFEQEKNHDHDEDYHEANYIHLNISNDDRATEGEEVKSSPIILINKNSGKIKTSTELPTTTSSTTAAPITLPPVRSDTTTTKRPTTRRTTTTTTTTTTPAPGYIASLTNSFVNPNVDLTNAVSFVGTVTLYSAAALMPFWLPLVVGKRKKRSLSEVDNENDYLTSKNDDTIELNYQRISDKTYPKYET